MKKTFLMLAHTYDPQKYSLNGWWYSEKLDGMRCYWDGGVSRGKLCRDISFANIEKDRVDRVATGLWSRYAKPIYAPVSFLESLPTVALDGELWSENGFQTVMTECKGLEPSFRGIRYRVFDCFTPGSFQARYEVLKGLKVDYVEQRVLPQGTASCKEALETELDKVLNSGGEGLVVKAPYSMYEYCRSHSMLKIKPFRDAEGIVIGWVPGKGKYNGMMGSLTLRLGNGLQFDLSGFTDNERLVSGGWPTHFPLSSIVTFRYRELTDSGIPKEARYFRKIA